MINCRNCSFPRKFARYFDWRSDGTIISKDRVGTIAKIVFLPSGELESIFEKLAERMGISVEHFLIEAQKNIGKALLENLPIRYAKKLPANRFFRPQWLTKLLVRILIAKDIAGLGDGRISLDKYIPGKVLVIRFKNPCVVPLLVGSSLGIYESIEKMEGSNVEYGIEESDLVIKMTHGEGKRETEERLYLEKVTAGSGQLEYERCPTCNAPLLAANTFSWNLKEGIITNKFTGKREVVVSVQSVNALLRELEKELGEDVLDLIYEIQKEIQKKTLPGDIEKSKNFWKEYLLGLGVRGFGYPLSFQVENSTIRIEIGNAYNHVLYAAKIAAALEVINSCPSRLNWEVREAARSIFTIEV